MTVFLKSGVLGILLLICSIVLLKNATYDSPETKQLNYLITGSIIFLFFSYWVFMGLYFKADTKSILIGLFIALIEKKKRHLQLNHRKEATT